MKSIFQCFFLSAICVTVLSAESQTYVQRGNVHEQSLVNLSSADFSNDSEKVQEARKQAKKALEDALERNMDLKERYERNQIKGLSKDSIVTNISSYNQGTLKDANAILGANLSEGDLVYAIQHIRFKETDKEMDILLSLFTDQKFGDFVKSAAIAGALKFKNPALRQRAIKKLTEVADMSEEKAFESNQLVFRAAATSALAEAGGDEVREYFIRRLLTSQTDSERTFLIRILKANNVQLYEILKGELSEGYPDLKMFFK